MILSYLTTNSFHYYQQRTKMISEILFHDDMVEHYDME